ncbi:MAG: hypothetical protein WCO52_01050 [bacterium]
MSKKTQIGFCLFLGILTFAASQLRGGTAPQVVKAKPVQPVTLITSAAQQPVVKVEGERNYVEVDVPYSVAAAHKTLPIAINGTGNLVKIHLVESNPKKRPAPSENTQVVKYQGQDYVIVTVRVPPNPEVSTKATPTLSTH